VPWLSPPNIPNNRLSRSDFEKRNQLLAEFMYYLIDSIIIPLIRSTFHVTESNSDKNKLFYFRLDIWRQISEPAMNELKLKSFEEMSFDSAKERFAAGSLGYSYIRLLPKTKGFRPITNLRRKQIFSQNGKKSLSLSINSRVKPAYDILRYEMV
jgi:telomerase reverse transcriptase